MWSLLLHVSVLQHCSHVSVLCSRATLFSCSDRSPACNSPSSAQEADTVRSTPIQSSVHADKINMTKSIAAVTLPGWQGQVLHVLWSGHKTRQSLVRLVQTEVRLPVSQSRTSASQNGAFWCIQVSKLLHYSPVTRMTALGALTHPFFDELREPNTTLPNGIIPVLASCLSATRYLFMPCLLLCYTSDPD